MSNIEALVTIVTIIACVAFPEAFRLFVTLLLMGIMDHFSK